MKNPVHDVIDSYVNNEYPDSIDREFRAWLTDAGNAAEKNRELSQLWESTDTSATPGFENSLEHMRELTGISARRTIRRLRRRRNIWKGVAAIALIALTAAAFTLSRPRIEVKPDLLQAYVPKARMQSLTLPDGTQVTLNANTTLIYPDKFTGGERCVYLTGEACFKVSPDARHPFIVKSADFQVTALGTEFNVEAYPEGDCVTATLISGKVRADFDNMSKSQILAPEQQIVYNRASRTASMAKADVSDVTAWQHGQIVMRGLTPDEIFTRLARKYPYTFIYSPHSLKSSRFTLTFSADAPLDEVMHITAKVMGNIRYSIEGDRCHIEAI